jgi:hypothetical protein
MHRHSQDAGKEGNMTVSIGDELDTLDLGDWHSWWWTKLHGKTSDMRTPWIKTLVETTMSLPMRVEEHTH